ncbi:TPA: sulfatase-like hydrolase/transferase, partial [Proteus mirabilis]|nr:sulfatase-like hydrolase/transferase [Proteus mirabilis]
SSLNKNFVFIFAESLERSYRDVNGINFLPNISKLENQLDFNNIKQTSGSGWTIAGNVNVLCGLPLFGVINQASLTETFLPKATCMTDQLNNIGYEQIYISGSSTIFAGTKNLLSNHKVNNIYDIEDFKKIISKKDIIAWGVTDDIVLEKAFDTFIEKSKNREKFAIYVSTVDTHFPDGVFLDVCKNKIDTTNISEEIQKSILCSDYLISELIKRIQKSDYYKDTTIVLISDHFMMGEQPYFKYSDRRNTFSIFSHDIKNTIINNEGSLIDVSPTVLSFITDEDIDFGFGVNLLNNNKKNPLLKSKDNDEYVSFVKDLWSLPNINDKIINHSSDYIRISGQKFKIPLSGYVDDNGKIIDFSATPHIVEKYKKDCLSKNNNHVFMINKINDDLILLLKSNNDELKEFKFDKNGNTLEIKKLKINENIDYVNNFM